MTGPDRSVTGADLGPVLRDAVAQQQAFETRRATRLGRGTERLTGPIGGLLGRVIPAGMVRGALRQADRAAGLTIRRFGRHDVDDLAACDAQALKVQAWAQGTNAASGGAAGMAGMMGMAIDIPATIALAARNVRATGAAYGFTDDNSDEQLFRLMVLEVATSLAERKRQDSLDRLNGLAGHLSRPEVKVVLEKGGEWMVDKIVDRIARQLGITLAGRKAGQVVPVIGGAVAAAVNASFQVDVARAARYAYRQRWLMTRQVLPAPEHSSEGA